MKLAQAELSGRRVDFPVRGGLSLSRTFALRTIVIWLGLR